ncbi:hypothetical protein [Haladaptatus sp. R4]|uniref:hypothetical protein n=1 Tax=Haladaptatus sp. R4 TaxID=1679489 RepID=UPI000AB2C905|nr:hypothetical protein [Haladaptatus sp. R4]
MTTYVGVDWASKYWVALALTAKKSKGNFETLPESPPEDDKGHRTAVVYSDA